MKIASFDIFDTCVARMCGEPDGVFDVLAKMVLPNADKTQLFDFALVRKRGYWNALQKFRTNEKEDVSLDEIYSCCDFSELGVTLSVKELIDMELSVESSLLVPICETLELINSMREKGCRIVFISDMYLPYDFVEKTIRRLGCMKDDDLLYVSSKSRKLKTTGNLFKLVQKEQGFSVKQWCHYGDNIIADYKVPRKLGIKAKRLEYSYSYYEKRMKKKDYSSCYKIGNMMAGISRAVRLQENDNIQTTFASNLIAPLFVSYVYSLLRDAQKKKIEHIYFLARDSNVFFEIAKVLEQDFPNISLHYLCVSRNSLYLPGLDEISYDSLMGIFSAYEWQGINDILARLHMLDYEIPDSLVNAYGADNILPVLLTDSNFVYRIEQERINQRKLCFDYFKQEGLCRRNCAIVDLNGSRTCHCAINKILSFYGAESVFGYYLEVMNRIVGTGYKAYNFSERYQENYAIAPRYLYEQYFCVTPFSRTIGYKTTTEGKITPLYESEFSSNDQRKDIYERNVRILRKFASAYRILLDRCDSHRCIDLSVAVNTEFYLYPKKEYLKCIEGFRFSDSKVREIFILYKHSLFRVLKNKSKYYWLYGNIINSSCFPELWRMLLKWKFDKKI